MSSEEATSSEPIRVVLVEDHLLTRIGLKTVLERTPDIRVVGEAENGEEAVRVVDEIDPDVILMDVGMPIMDGIEAAKKIRSKHKDANIIMLTSHDNEQDIFASLSAGAGGYCLKDVAPERLYTAIRSVNEGDVWLDSTIANKVVKYYGSGEPSAQPAAAAPQKAESTPPASAPTRPPLPNLPDPLSQRELEVLNLLVEGLSNQEIADRLIISLATAKTHVRNILNKLAVDDRTQAAVQAMRRGLV
ncbi:MAG TPA: response regulator transcription factor [Candidatus Obscuribacterales bacterium]